MQSEAAVLSKPSLWREASRIVNEEGVRAFWKGNMVTVAHRLPYSALNFYAYEKYNKVSCFVAFYHDLSLSLTDTILFLFLQFFYSNPILQSYLGNGSSSPFVHFVSGGLAGITAASATYPLDLVRTRLAAQVLILKSVCFVCL